MFNRHDYSKCSKLHQNTYFLPFSAAKSFVRPPRRNDFKFDILVVMNTYHETKAKAEKVFQELCDAQTDPANLKMLELCRALMELTVEKHKNIVDKNKISEFLDNYIRECGADPFNADKKSRFCAEYGQILSYEQRAQCVIDLCRTGHKVDVFGDLRWKSILADYPNATWHGCAQYNELADLYNSAKININLTQIKNLDSIPQRIFHLLASGGFALTNFAEELESFFSTSVHLESFKSFDEMVGKVCYYMENEEERIKIATQGQEEFLLRHSMDNRLSYICSVALSS